ncbi:hypothetical protein OH491_20880 [Termitidicoccus mucosus]|uniref:Dihydrodipicolinate synthase family protein n=1 Tax=Termitidicoccus mucosus TaxID=1184151 RepID=A0A178IE26_9BACT|nr:hypothetical protein AW736_22835 [Opitutaceae bacterium TSB47]
MIILPKGIVSVMQTAFSADGSVDMSLIEDLAEDAIAVGVDGFLLPVVASEMHVYTVCGQRGPDGGRISGREASSSHSERI